MTPGLLGMTGWSRFQMQDSIDEEASEAAESSQVITDNHAIISEDDHDLSSPSFPPLKAPSSNNRISQKTIRAAED